MAPNSSTIQTASNGRTWTIGNGLVERKVRFEVGHGLTTVSWRSLVTGTDFMQRAQQAKSPGREFSFVADGRQFSGAGPAFDFLRVEIREVKPDGKVLCLHLAARATKLEVCVCYAIYDGHPVIRKWIEIRNLTGALVTLSDLAYEELNMTAADPAHLQVSAFYGIAPREIFLIGRAEDAAIAERDSRTGEGFVVVNEAPGWMKRTAAWSWGFGIRVMYETDLFPFERRVAPGETFVSAKSSIAFFLDRHLSMDSRWVMPSYASEVIHRGGSAYQPPWIYNTWVPFGPKMNAGLASELMPVAGRMGFDVFTIDEGWQAEIGENACDTELFPKGLDQMVSLAARHRLRLGLWTALATVSPKSRVYREHPEWICRDVNGEPKHSGTNSDDPLRMMCLATPFREFAARRIIELIGRYQLKYVKLDFPTVFNAYGLRPGCHAKGHEHKTWAESLGRIYEGIEEVTARIHREHPDVLLDLTFELWGQLHLLDYGLLDSGDLDWLSNVDDRTPESAGPVQARTLLYQRSLAMPTEAMLIGSLLAERPPIDERFATAIGSGPLLLGELRKLSLAQQAWYAERIKWFKRLRSRLAITEGFFPLGSWLQPGAATWDGFARLCRSGEGLIAIFRNQSGVEKVKIQIPAFPDGSFRLNATMTAVPPLNATGKILRSGIELAVPDEHAVEVFEVSRP